MSRCLTFAMHGGFALALILGAGCGATKSQMATEQLLMSDAVDRSIATIDFRAMAGEKVYLDTRYVQNVKGFGFVNADYIISSLRQQLAAANCLLQESPNDADYVVEARVGALGTDGHSVVYGMPASNLLSSASAVLPSAPVLPALPELSVARREDQVGAAKIGVFAYHRESRQPVWQSGIAQSASTAGATWILGVGPFQRGTIYGGTRFAGTDFSLPLVHDDQEAVPEGAVRFDDAYVFPGPWSGRVSDEMIEADPAGVQAAGYQATGSDAPAGDTAPASADDPP